MGSTVLPPFLHSQVSTFYAYYLQQWACKVAPLHAIGFLGYIMGMQRCSPLRRLIVEVWHKQALQGGGPPMGSTVVRPFLHNQVAMGMQRFSPLCHRLPGLQYE
ncbi:hypothetical protein L226DRAFT_527771 [Lentinus tigrinus ALCF2SS1-7]|uniref:uncharacterized protein n=1 Tax=Lentinus tigrinus ALCF2SS1-7 TaxID=1328758 RepID=UPI001165EAC1|nr:hypothetical protein L226DRAFT_527771 [Lentinus tigrinus ALCF2SS1-7]